jgi:hypothetical protein
MMGRQSGEQASLFYEFRLDIRSASIVQSVASLCPPQFVITFTCITATRLRSGPDRSRACADAVTTPRSGWKRSAATAPMSESTACRSIFAILGTGATAELEPRRKCPLAVSGPDLGVHLSARNP